MSIEARTALFEVLLAHGYEPGADSAGAGEVLYIRGKGDSAAALFEFKMTAGEACATMYQGSWLPSMPPRFAVLPESERVAPEIDFLDQAGLSVLFYVSGDKGVEFLDMEEALAEVDRRSATRS